jgi:hypothetical protein
MERTGMVGAVGDVGLHELVPQPVEDSFEV